MPSFNDSIVVPFGLAELAGASSAGGVLAYKKKLERFALNESGKS